MTEGQIGILRKETEEMFYHGYDNYMKYAFPEDELRPVSCTPLTRDRNNPAHVELNDVLGNYSLTLIDSLSTLAILASSSPDKKGVNRALREFQQGVASFVQVYGDGSSGRAGQGTRARGFDVDSKVQVFETVIRGLGGLLSAHLFAVGDLPIRGYEARADTPVKAASGDTTSGRSMGIGWPNGFIYDGQLLRLAHDLGKRLLPAFYTTTGIPYPRVNLRYGIPFYTNSPFHYDAENGQCQTSPIISTEVTETCSAGAGSLILEFSTLTRLTGDDRFEQLAKRAFWAVWSRRSTVGLVGFGIDAESGLWNGPYTGIGAGIDSFFEYSLKSYILLSGLSPTNYTLSESVSDAVGNPNALFPALTDEANAAESFLYAWQDAHSAVKRHLYRGSTYHHPHYVQGDLYTGATRAFWIDSLSAFYPGLLTLAGELEEAIETHLLYTALWTRYSALPERWSTATGSIEGGLRWWGGRPEFIESTFYLFRATKDPWYLYVGEMALRDIKRRCWTRCGWAGLQDVRTGEQSDRMESFFLGETAKYMFLLFDPTHPLNTLDAPFVFTTEGHPLIIPRRGTYTEHRQSHDFPSETHAGIRDLTHVEICPLPSGNIPFSISATAARPDLFHAASLTRLHLIPNLDTLDSPLVEFSSDHPSVSVSDLHSPSNYSFYPWTLPPYLIPINGFCSKLAISPSFDITFPMPPNTVVGSGTLNRVRDGIYVNSMGGLRLGMIRDDPTHPPDDAITGASTFRIQTVSGVAMGRDEKVFISKDVMNSVVSASDPNFMRIRDTVMLDIAIDIPVTKHLTTNSSIGHTGLPPSDTSDGSSKVVFTENDNSEGEAMSHMKIAFQSLIQQFSSMLQDHPAPIESSEFIRDYIPAITPTGIGAVPIPDMEDAPSPDFHGAVGGNLMWKTIYIADELCDRKLATIIPKEHHIIVLKRGGCSFSTKLQNIPSYAPSSTGLQLVIFISYPENDSYDTPPPADNWLIRPLLDEPQRTPGGLPRHHPVPMVMVGGGVETYEKFKKATAVGMKRRYRVESQGVPVSNLIVV
ncbi:MAG: alpha mannosidase-like protein [Pycnora praestabilis]|nr:MAG: alpha mannosidase-like protein [Pycnora praestabilis]